jgi:hypothetical protein
MPIVNYYIEAPQYTEYLWFPCTNPYLFVESGTSEVIVSWDIDLALGPTIIQDDDNPYETQFLILWWERRWWGQDEYWVRAYCMGASWDAVTPLPPLDEARKKYYDRVRQQRAEILKRHQEKVRRLRPDR